MDINYAIDKLVGAVGDIPLAVERYNRDGKKQSNDFVAINEYQFLEGITANPEACNQLIARYRLLTIIKTFELINNSQTELSKRLEELKPSELSRMHTAMVQAFSALTNPSTKVAFDFDAEIRKVAVELEVSVEEVAADVKAMMAKK